MTGTERDRLTALSRYDILDTPAEEAFDRITRLTRRLLGVTMATVTLVDADRQWFKSRQGVDLCQTARGSSICSVAIGAEGPTVVEDTLRDPRFASSPLVVGEPRIRFYAGAPLVTSDGHAIGTLCAMDTVPRDCGPDMVEALRDLAHIVMSEMELRLIATTDGLTGAMSRRAFREAMARACSDAGRHARDLCCAMFDIDHFKAVNDLHGHGTGDMALAQVAAACRGELRSGDLLGRLGGEEFAVLLPSTGPEGGMRAAERLRDAIGRVVVQTRTATVRVTSSFGMASMGPGAVTADEMLRRADVALYAAKSGGRDRCVAWEDGGGPGRQVA